MSVGWLRSLGSVPFLPEPPGGSGPHRCEPHPCESTFGRRGRLEGWNDQNIRPSAMSISRFCGWATFPSRGSGAPISTHLTKSAITPAGKFRVRRHLKGLVPNGGNEQALFHLAGHGRRSTFASFSDSFPRVEPQFPLQFAFPGRLGGMASIAPLNKHGPNLRFEELPPFRRGFFSKGSGERKVGEEQAEPRRTSIRFMGGNFDLGPAGLSWKDEYSLMHWSEEIPLF